VTTPKRTLIRLGGIAASFVISTTFSSAFSPMGKDDVISHGDHVGRRLNMSNDADAAVYGDDLPSLMAPGDYDALHSLQSGMRTPNEIQDDIAKIAGQGPVVQWNSDFWQKNKIKGPLRLVTMLSHIQNLETRFEVMHLLTLPSEKRREMSITLFTDRMNAAEISTLHSSLLVAKTILFNAGRPVYDLSNLSRFNFHLDSSSLDSSVGDLREPEGQYDFAPLNADDKAVDPFAELGQINGSFNEVGNYEYDQVIGGQHCTVSIIPRWTEAAKSRGANPQALTIEVQIHEAESLNVRSFVLVYE
jgi:hypothetical protein